MARHATVIGAGIIGNVRGELSTVERHQGNGARRGRTRPELLFRQCRGFELRVLRAVGVAGKRNAADAALSEQMRDKVKR
jgi:hypothetical protein